MTNIPVFFVHIGSQDYLKVTINQAQKYNKDVLLIGDESNKTYCDKWFNIYDQYGPNYEQLKKDYVHMSTNSAEFEFSAISKFLAVYNVAEMLEYSELMLLDSDLMSYVNYSEIDWSSYDAGFSIPNIQEPYIWTVSVHCSYWKISALRSFINYLLSVYHQDMNLLQEKWEYDTKNARTGGICDMTLVYLWYKKHPELKFFNTCMIMNNTTFDHFLAFSEGYNKGDFQLAPYLGIKKIKFIEGVPYFRYKNGKWIRTYTLHAQGGRKIYISDFGGKNPNVFALYRRKIITDINRVFRFLKRCIKI